MTTRSYLKIDQHKVGVGLSEKKKQITEELNAPFCSSVTPSLIQTYEYHLKLK